MTWGAPRTYKEIGLMFHIPSRSIASNDICNTKPSDLAVRVLAQLDISRTSMVRAIATQADTLFQGELCSVSPQSALAVAIALAQPFLNKQMIAGNCHISKQTLLKHIRRVTRYKKEK